METGIRIFGGLLFFGFGLYFLISNTELIRTGIKVKGIVLEIDERLDYDRDYVHYVTVKFSDEAKKEHILETLDRTLIPNYEVGDSIDLVYPKNNVKMVRNNATFPIYIFPCIFILLGLILFRKGCLDL